MVKYYTKKVLNKRRNAVTRKRVAEKPHVMKGGAGPRYGTSANYALYGPSGSEAAEYKGRVQAQAQLAEEESKRLYNKQRYEAEEDRKEEERKKKERNKHTVNRIAPQSRRSSSNNLANIREKKQRQRNKKQENNAEFAREHIYDRPLSTYYAILEHNSDLIYKCESIINLDNQIKKKGKMQGKHNDVIDDNIKKLFTDWSQSSRSHDKIDDDDKQLLKEILTRHNYEGLIVPDLDYFYINLYNIGMLVILAITSSVIDNYKILNAKKNQSLYRRTVRKFFSPKANAPVPVDIERLRLAKELRDEVLKIILENQASAGHESGNNEQFGITPANEEQLRSGNPDYVQPEHSYA
jgi:hypothetical protein